MGTMILTLTASMMFLVAGTETPLAWTPIWMYLNMSILTSAWTLMMAVTRVFLARSVLRWIRLSAMSRARGVISPRSRALASEALLEAEGGESW